MKLTVAKTSLWVLVAVVLGAAVYGVNVIVSRITHAPEQNYRDHVKLQIAQARTNTGTTIALFNEFARDEFLKEMGQLADVSDFRLDVEYGSGADEFLAGIRGMPGLKMLVVGKADLSEAGLQHIATLPDLETLYLYHVPLNDTGLEHLRACPRLRYLNASPLSGRDISLPNLLASARVEGLMLEEPYREQWLKNGIEDIAEAPSLAELRLYCSQLAPEDVERLRAKLPNCTVRAFKERHFHGQGEIAPLDIEVHTDPP
jgi:hypothetical protein